MNYDCPNLACLSHRRDCKSSKIAFDGSFFRLSDSRKIQRYRCKLCNRRFSQATFDTAYGQNKRRVNSPLKKLYCSGVSIRRAALILSINKNTVANKIKYLAQVAKSENQKFLKGISKIKKMQFDDLQTIEHTKCKPLSVTMAVESTTRKILGFEVSSMPATGHLAKISKQKYGYRKDERQVGLEKLFSKIQSSIHKDVQIISDEHPYYYPKVKKYFPKADYIQVKGARSCVAGQGELKKLKFDPLFSINHTFAMLRANINRLIRKSWCTTKLPEQLSNHIAIYVSFHNSVLTK